MLLCKNVPARKQVGPRIDKIRTVTVPKDITDFVSAYAVRVSAGNIIFAPNGRALLGNCGSCLIADAYATIPVTKEAARFSGLPVLPRNSLKIDALFFARLEQTYRTRQIRCVLDDYPVGTQVVSAGAELSLGRGRRRSSYSVGMREVRYYFRRHLNNTFVNVNFEDPDKLGFGIHISFSQPSININYPYRKDCMEECTSIAQFILCKQMKE